MDDHNVPWKQRVLANKTRIYFDSLIIAILNIGKKNNLINISGLEFRYRSDLTNPKPVNVICLDQSEASVQTHLSMLTADRLMTLASAVSISM